MYDVIIIGAGAAGLMAGAHLQNKHILIIEKNQAPGKKLLITGGGRCNLTNLKDNKLFLETIDYNKKYLYSAIYRFGPREIFEFFNAFVPLKIEEDDKVFPRSNKASDILNFLIEKNKKTTFKYHEVVTGIVKNDFYEVKTNKDTYHTKNVIVATGGKSFKETGSTGDAEILAKMVNQNWINLFPAEVSLRTSETADLAGTSFEHVICHLGKIKKEGHLIFTHRGLSGEAPMKISEFVYLNNDHEMTVDFLPSVKKEELLSYFTTDKEQVITTFLNRYFTKRFTSYLLDKCTINHNALLKQINGKTLTNLISLIKEHPFYVTTEVLEKAYVTGGGVDLKHLNTSTFESTINSGLYFIGECADMHGPIGGFNLTLAFSSAYNAACSINEKMP